MRQEKPSREWHGAHHPWAYRPHCFRWSGSDIVGVNFVPLATEMRAWLSQKGHLALAPESGNEGKGGYSNPYTFNGATLGLILSRAVNYFHDYIEADPFNKNEVDVEIERLRIHNELLIYAARFCEVVIKQLLYCTQIPEKQFSRMALGALLESPCPSCKKENGKQPHSTSMMGTLAHPFQLCREFEDCAMDHMALVNMQRNTEAAHSDIQTLNIRTAAESRRQILSDCDEILTRFLHMLLHLERLETSMYDDLVSKGKAIMLLKRDGLAPEDCNFNLEPGEVVRPPKIRAWVASEQGESAPK